MVQMIAGVGITVIQNLCKRTSEETFNRHKKHVAGHEVLVLQAVLYKLEELAAPVMWEDVILLHDIIRAGKERKITLYDTIFHDSLRDAVMKIERASDRYQPKLIAVPVSTDADDDDIPF